MLDDQGGPMFDRYIGLGMNCEVVVQLRRLTGCRQAHVFDWQLTTHDALMHVLRTGFADYFRLENLVLPEHRKHVLDTATGLEFHHLFPHNIDGTILPERMARAYPQVRARTEHLMRRWRETVASNLAVLYVRRDPTDELTEANLVELRDVLWECYPGHRFALVWVRDGPGGDVAELADGVYVTDVPVLQPRLVLWQGEDTVWDEVFPKLQQLHPLGASAAQHAR
jgi:Putative papain-like cysteine peptidase (DUF1796)